MDLMCAYLALKTGSSLSHLMHREETGLEVTVGKPFFIKCNKIPFCMASLNVKKHAILKMVWIQHRVFDFKWIELPLEHQLSQHLRCIHTRKHTLTQAHAYSSRNFSYTNNYFIILNSSPDMLVIQYYTFQILHFSKANHSLIKKKKKGEMSHPIPQIKKVSSHK